MAFFKNAIVVSCISESLFKVSDSFSRIIFIITFYLSIMFTIILEFPQLFFGLVYARKLTFISSLCHIL